MKSYLIGGGIIAGALVVAFLLVALAPEPPTSAPPPESPLVTTVRAEARSGSLTVRGYGTVRPAVEIDLPALVGGQVVEVSDDFVSGGTFAKGQTLLRIDPSDYRNAVDRAQATVRQRQVEVLQAKEEVAIAREEYQRLQRRVEEPLSPDSTGGLGSLVFREPQLRRAEANLQSAEAQFGDAQLNLRRTTIAAPFDGRIRTKRVDQGAYVAPGTAVATVYGTDMAEIVVPLTASKAALVPGLWRTNRQRGRTPVPARVALAYGAETFAWDGYVDRVEGTLDPDARTVDVVVRVPDPFAEGRPVVEPQARERADLVERPPLPVNAYVTVDLGGQQLDRYLVVPRQAVRDGDAVWTVENDSTLVVRPVEVIQSVDRQAFVRADIADGTPIVTSDLRIVSDSMTVRVAESSVGGGR